MGNINYKSKILTEKKAQLELLTSQYKKSKERETKENERMSFINEAKIFLQETALDLQNSISIHISESVSSALASIWGEEAFRFDLSFVPKRGQTEVEMKLLDGDKEIELKDLNSIGVGGGYLDVVALGLRIALWSLKKGRGLIFLDQPFQNLDCNHTPLAGELLKSLSKELGIQFVLINHDPQLAETASITYEVVKTNGICNVTQV